MPNLNALIPKARREVYSPELLSVLEERLPFSCFMCNQLKVHRNPDLENELEIFTLEDDSFPGNESNLWVALKFFREDWGQCVTLSAPAPRGQQLSYISPRMKTSLELSGILDWSEPFVFICVDPIISDFLMSLNIRKFGNNMKIFPLYLFHMDRIEALGFDVSSGDPSVEIRPLTLPEGEQFLISNWKFKGKGTHEYVRKCITNSLAMGIYLNGELVCGALAPGRDGLISSLATHPSHRRQGYATLLMKYMFREMALNGLQPCLDTEMNDATAVGFHKSGPLEIVGKVDHVCFKAL